MQNKKLITGLISALQIAAFLLACFFVARAVMTYLSPQSAWEPVRQVSVAPTQKAQNRAVRPASLAYDPFYRDLAVDEVVAEQQDDNADAPETTLDLTLTGLISGEDGRVTLKTSNNVQTSYGVGDEIIRGVTLKAIHGDYIVLDREGQIERLTFERTDTVLLENRETEDAATSLSLKSKNTVAQKAPQNNSTEAKKEAKPNVTYEPVDLNLIDGVSLQKVVQNNFTQGYTVNSDNSAFKLQMLGLQDGDIIEKVGRYDLREGNPNFDQIFASLLQTGGADISVIRNGQSQTVRVNLP